MITENTAKFAGGSYLKQRYYDQIKPKIETKETMVSGDQIANNIIGGLTSKKV